MIIKGKLVDIRNQTVYPASIEIQDGKILRIEKIDQAPDRYIMPGFVDAHVHIESSMLVPSEFARIAVVHGTVATVSDPHEIANVNGLEGVEFMIENGNKVPFKFNFGAPSCVPATSFETAGAVVGPEDIEKLMARPEVRYLAEMMNYPGVLFNDPIVMEKIAIAKKYGKPIDGHAPGLQGEDAIKYISAGISTDHECYSYEEALHKLKNNMKVIIREGSAAKNFEALIDLLPEYYEQMMFCSDDKHPDNLLEGHINQLAARAVAKGIDVYKVLLACCINPVEHYSLEVGLLQTGDPADFILVEDLTHFKVLETWIDGVRVAQNGTSNIESVPFELLNNFNTSLKEVASFSIKAESAKVAVIEALDGELITNRIEAQLKPKDGFLVSDTDQDILKMALVNRYKEADTSLAFIKNFGLKSGAIASCVGHDSHNIVVVGVDDESICRAVNLIIENKGGISAVNGTEEQVLPLPVAGIMSDKDAHTVAAGYSKLDSMAKEMGSKLNAPYMTLSFMALLVIPSLKLSDLGLFDGSKFEFTPLQIPNA